MVAILQVMEEVAKCLKAFDEDQTGYIKAKQVIEVCCASSTGLLYPL